MPLSTGVMIQIVMGVVATVIVLTCKVNIKNVVTQSTMTSGLIGLIALFGIAWLADTWISHNEAQIVGAMGELVEQWKWFIAIAIFIVAASDDEPGGSPGGDRADRPRARHPAAVPRRVRHRLHRHLLLPGERLPGHRDRHRRDRNDQDLEVRHLALVLAARCS